MPRRSISSTRLQKTAKAKAQSSKKKRFVKSTSTKSHKSYTWLNQWKWGESYTSLLLGIVVVIVGTLFVVSIVKEQHKNIQQTSSIATSPTAVSPSPTSAGVIKNTKGQKTYTVQAGDDLWSISEKFYNSGYNWVDIAKANNLADPSTIHSGNQLLIPSISPAPTPTGLSQQVQPNGPNAITGNTYTVQKGDDLWTIAVRAYADGYRWTDIAKANNLADPGLIFSGNVLTIPR